MNNAFSIILLITILSVCCKNTPTGKEFTRVAADSLVTDIDKYNNTAVDVEGVVVHLCGVDGKKMKLMTENGTIIKIVPQDSLASFDKSLFKKRIKVRGIAKESRIEKPYLNKMESEKALLCHIDHTPCKDTAWVNSQIEAGKADTLSKSDIDNLRSIMEQTGKNYVSVVTIVAEKIEVIAEATK